MHLSVNPSIRMSICTASRNINFVVVYGSGHRTPQTISWYNIFFDCPLTGLRIKHINIGHRFFQWELTRESTNEVYLIVEQGVTA